MLARLLNWIRARRIPVLPSREAYAQWAASYPPIPHNPFMQLEENTLLDMLPPLNGKRVLDLACGSGRWGRVASERGAAHVFSADDSFDMLHGGKPSHAMQAGMTALPMPNACVDVILCGLAIGHVATFEEALSEMRRVLRPGGIALISDVHPTQAWHGAKRTFQNAQGKTLAVEHHIHSYAVYHAAAQKLGFMIDDVREVAVTPGKAPVLLAIQLSLP